MQQVLARIPEWHDVDSPLFEREIVSQYRPAVLRGVVRHWPIVEQARISPLAVGNYLHKLDNGTPVQAIMIPPGIDRRVFYQADLRGVNFIRNKLPISAIIEQVLRYSAFPNPPSVAVQSALIADCLPGFLDAHPMPLLAARPSPRIWLGNRLTVPAHIDEGNNIACVVSGARRFTLFPPEQIANLYVGPLEFTPNAAPVSMVDAASPDFDRFPRYKDALAAAQVAELAAGDALFIPALWWHQVESLSAMNILINYWWGGSFGAAQSPVDCLLHGLVVMKHLPPEHRAAWSHYFQHFLFAADAATAAHIPADRRGVLGELTPEHAQAIKARLIARLQS
jgi:Cupin-like domain